MRLEVGRIAKPHGLRGELAVVLLTERTERLAPGTVLETDRGPLRVEASRPHGRRWLVHFAEIHDRSEAETWRGTTLLAPPVDEPDDSGEPGVYWVHELVGARVELPGGEPVGTVEAVQANPAADLLVLDNGALVPVVFVTDRRPGVVVIDPPEGLLDL